MLTDERLKRVVPRRLSTALAHLTLVVAAAQAPAGEPIRLHPDNPHYFLFRGRPTVLITSAEHYGAVLNPDFDYKVYLQTLEACGFNLTRAFSGAYCEPSGAHGIVDNTLAPAPGRLLCPWARSTSPGHANGGSKFDLTRWDPAYFQRLRDFVAEAGRRGVVVEVVMFCPFYDPKPDADMIWKLSPMNAANNVNGIGNVARKEVYTLKPSPLLDVQVAMVRKIVETLRESDNVYYEICNEPYHGGVAAGWENYIARVITDTEARFDKKHLIAQNIANKSRRITDPDPLVSVFNFHYAKSPHAVSENYHLNRVIADDETGFAGREADPYRREAWAFILSGGAVFNHLDYSFTCGRENGTTTSSAPGGGGPEIRRQLVILKKFVESFDFVRMRPDTSIAARVTPNTVSAYALVEPGRAYAAYLTGTGPATLRFDLSPGTYTVEWINTKTGETDKQEIIEHKDGERAIQSPIFEQEIAMRMLQTTKHHKP